MGEASAVVLHRLDVTIAGETNLDLILYGLPEQMPTERELLATGFEITLDGSSSILAHNLAMLGSRVGFQTEVGGDELGRIAMQYLAEAKVDLSRGRHRHDKKTGVTILLPHGDKRHILSHPVSWPISRYGILISAISQTPSTFISRHYSYSAFCIRACLPSSRSLERQV